MGTNSIIFLSLILVVSVVIFTGTIYLGYSNNHNLDKGEMRRAISAFVISLFGLLVAASFFEGGPEVPAELRGLFAGLITTIIGFYFGQRAGEAKT